MNSPFREFTKQRLVDIIKRGAKGVYFDQDHMPEVCYCDNCTLAFARINGKPMPVEAVPGTVEYLEMTRFVGNTLAVNSGLRSLMATNCVSAS